ncbi:MAG: aldose epimerase family protein [Chitinophagaceae bacterium]
MLQPNQQFCFTHPGGEDIYLFTLQNAKGTEAVITNYGGILTAFRIIQQDGHVNNIVLGFDKVEEYLAPGYLASYPFFGAAIGRYGNRIKDGRFSIDGKAYMVHRNLPPDHLHGGREGFDKKVWQCTDLSSQSLTLQYRSPDGEEGYPGNLDVTLRFELNDDNELSHEYTAVTDQPTPVNLTHHSYFNLNNGKGTIGDQSAKIKAAEILEQDANLSVTGNLLPVANTPYDFRELKRLDTDWEPGTGYDQSFVIDPSAQQPAAEAYSDKSGIGLQVFTTEPIVHLYTGGGIPPLAGSEGNTYGPFSGFCLETQVHPNAVNIPDFPNTVLRPGETYRQKTTYRLIVHGKR